MISPCVQVCRLEDGVCAGCGRTIEQITAAGMERIAAAAIMHKGQVVHLPPPARHGTIVRHIVDVLDLTTELPIAQPEEQGFVTNTGRFVSREDAYRIAGRADQLPVEGGSSPGYLFSEDVW